MGKSVEISLKDQADILYPCLSDIKSQYDAKELNNCDLVSLFILLCLAIQRPKRWLGGKLPTAIYSSQSCDNIQLSTLSRRLTSFSSTIQDILDLEYVAKKLGKHIKCDEICIIDVFNTMQLYGIKKNKDNYINISLVEWARGLRPYVLMFTIPTPMQVLRLQSAGTRVVTLFVNYEELTKLHIAMLYYMDGDETHAKDCLEFTMHDLKHMELFAHSDIYQEQVGFFRCVLNSGYEQSLEELKSLDSCLSEIDFVEMFDNCSKDISAFKSHLFEIVLQLKGIGETIWHYQYTTITHSQPRKIYEEMFSLDLLLWRELEYVISDMNCYSTHLIRYLLAKLLIAIDRKFLGQVDTKIIKNLSYRYWLVILVGIGFTQANEDPALFEAGVDMLHTCFGYRGSMVAREGELIRDYFIKQSRL